MTAFAFNYWLWKHQLFLYLNVVIARIWDTFDSEQFQKCGTWDWGSTQRQQQTLKMKEKTQKQTKKTPKQPKRVKSFLYSCLLACRIRHCSPLQWSQHYTWRHNLPYSAWLTSLLSHRLHRASQTQAWSCFGLVFYSFFPQSKENPWSWAASCFKQFIQREANYVRLSFSCSYNLVLTSWHDSMNSSRVTTPSLFLSIFCKMK